MLNTSMSLQEISKYCRPWAIAQDPDTCDGVTPIAPYAVDYPTGSRRATAELPTIPAGAGISAPKTTRRPLQEAAQATGSPMIPVKLCVACSMEVAQTTRRNFQYTKQQATVRPCRVIIAIRKRHGFCHTICARLDGTSASGNGRASGSTGRTHRHA